MKKYILFFLLLFIFPISIYAHSRSTIVMDVDSGRVLYAKNSSEKQLIASITKIMTAIVVLENCDMEKEITVGEEVLSMYGTNIYIKPGEVIKVKDLLYGLMLRSGNDAAITLAVQTFGEEEFIKKMNDKAKELGMRNTLFQNPHGLDDDTKNSSTAYDMALLGRYAFQNQLYRKIISTKRYITKSSLKSYDWYNRMSLLNRYEYCVGGKNGYTPRAGKTLVSYAQKGNATLMIVTLDNDNIYEMHRQLYETYFSKYKKYTIINPRTFHLDSNIIQGHYNIKDSFEYLLSENEIGKVSTLIEFYPVTKEKKAGLVHIKLYDKEIGTLDIYQDDTIKKEDISIFQKIRNLFIR